MKNTQTVKVVLITLLSVALFGGALTFFYQVSEAKEELKAVRSTLEVKEKEIAERNNTITKLEAKLSGVKTEAQKAQEQADKAQKTAQGTQSTLNRERSTRDKACQRVGAEASRVIVDATCLFAGFSAGCSVPADLRQTAINYGVDVYKACME